MKDSEDNEGLRGIFTEVQLEDILETLENSQVVINVNLLIRTTSFALTSIKHIST